jgi:DNA-3-methyladenine glycosylase II
MRKGQMRRIDTCEDIRSGLEALIVLEPRLAHVAGVAGEVPLRRHPAGFESLAGIIVSQQISKASADAIFARLKAAIEPLTPERLLDIGERGLVSSGLSRPKQKTFLAVAEACRGGLDLAGLCELPAAEAIAAMTAMPGIGPWTAEVYLLFCAGHPDIFPAGDIALQNAVRHAFSLEARPTPKPLSAIAERWAPHRSVAARLFWAYYAKMKGRDGAPL